MAQDEAFHLYLLIGQSNMAGRGEVEAEDREAHPRVVALGKADQWVPAVDPIHFDKAVAGVGPGLTFGKTMAGRDPSIRIGLLPCAAGGSPISVWKPGGHWEQTNSDPYDDALRRTKLAMADGVLKGMLWHQGESDANETDAGQYEDRLVALIGALRSELGTPDVPFIAATLGDFLLDDRPEVATVNEALRSIPERVDFAACVDAGGLCEKGDKVHFDAESPRELGRRYAEAMIRLQQT